jgi:hypothetical protein
MKRWGVVVGVLLGLVLVGWGWQSRALAEDPPPPPPEFQSVFSDEGRVGVLINNPVTGSTGFNLVTFTSYLSGGEANTTGGTSTDIGATGVIYPNQTAEGGGPKIAGYYQSTNPPYKYYQIQVNPVASNPGDDVVIPPCPCGKMAKVDGERYCETECAPPTCARVYPQQTQTSRTSGDFYIFVDDANDHSTRDGFPDPKVYVDVWSETNGQDDLRRYEAIRYGNYFHYDPLYHYFYVKINLADHPGMGVINIAGTVVVWPYGASASCPATNFSRLSYITGNVYYDPEGSCSTAQPWTLTSNLGVGYNNGGGVTAGSVISSGDYAGMYIVSSNLASNVSLQLLNIPAAYTCSPCNTLTCPNTASVAPGSINNNFFLTDAGSKLAWWQAQGAGAVTF